MAKKVFKSRRPKEVKEFDEEVLEIARVTRVVKGGRRLRFRATVIIGNRKGKVGIGTGKSAEVAAAIQKAVAKAKRQIIKVPLTDVNSIPHEVRLKFKASKLLLMPAYEGTGIIAGGAVRKIAELAGIKNMYGKLFGTSNKLTNAKATILALEELRQVEKKVKKESTDNKIAPKAKTSETLEKKEVKKETIETKKPVAEKKAVAKKEESK